MTLVWLWFIKSTGNPRQTASIAADWSHGIREVINIKAKINNINGQILDIQNRDLWKMSFVVQVRHLYNMHYFSNFLKIN